MEEAEGNDKQSKLLMSSSDTANNDNNKDEIALFITNPDIDCIKLEITTFKFGDEKTGW